MGTKHTPEPWTYRKDEWGYYYLVEDVEKPEGILCEGLDEEDAKRIVQCVNACAGMEDPAKQINDLRTQLDEAVKALEKFTILNPQHYKDIAGLIKNATDTITKLKGGQP